MEAMFVYFLVKFTDPNKFYHCWYNSVFSIWEKWAKPVAIIGAAVFVETILASSQSIRVWGNGIIFAIIVHSVQAWICDFFIKRYKLN